MVPVNALMTIQVRVIGAQALAQMRAMEASQKRMAVSGTAAAGGISRVNNAAKWGIPAISKWGNQVQWAGRQLMYNFTLPLALAGGAAVKWQMDNEKAMVRVRKVYGDGSKQMKQWAKTEIPALQEAFRNLSNEFGVNQAEVINVAADWAAAGASGIALARVTKLTLETMVLGEIDAAEATRNLLAIQAQYGHNTKQLAQDIDLLNMVENQTAVTMKDLMDSMARSAGVARVAGMDMQHLAAVTAALVPAAGNAANAGNAIKTLLSRILSPTQDAVNILTELGIQLDAQAWKMGNATQNLETLSKAYYGLSKRQQVHVASVMASRWQLNRFVVLMKAVRDENSRYHKALDATSNKQKIYKQRVFELNQVLKSNPQLLKQAWVNIQNGMSKAIIPIIPHIVNLTQNVAHMMEAFGNLNPVTQKWIVYGLLILALIGPLARYVGAVANLIGIMTGAIHFLVGGLIKMVSVMLLTPFKWFISGLALISRAAILAGGAMLQFAGFVAAGTIGAFKWLNPAMWAAAFARIPMAAMVMAPIKKMMIAPVLAGASGAFAILLQYVKNIITLFTGKALFDVFKIVGEALVMSFVGLAGAMVGATQAVWAHTVAAAAKGGAATVSTIALTAARTAAIEAKSAAERIFVVNSMGEAIISTEAAVAADRTFHVNAAAQASTHADEVASARRTFIVDSMAAAIVSAETGAASQRLFIAGSAAGQTLAIEETTATRRVWLDQLAWREIVSWTLGGSQARLALITNAATSMIAIEGSRVRTVLAIEAGTSQQRIFLASATTGVITALAADEAAQRIFYVNSVGVATIGWERSFSAARIAIQAGTVGQLIAITAGYRGTMLALEGGTATERTALAVYTGEAVAAAEATSAAERIFIVSSTAETILGIIGSEAAARVFITTGSGETMLSIQSAVAAARLAIESGTATEMLAITTGASAAQTAVAVRTGATLVATNAATNTTLVATNAAGATATVGIWARARMLLFGIFTSLFTLWKRVLLMMVGIVPAIVSAMFSPFGIAILAVVGLTYAFRDKIVAAWHSLVGASNDVANGVADAFTGIGNFFHNLVQTIVDLFWKLPVGVQNAMLAVIQVVRDAALAVYEWFSYLNPFAHHSPSLVENVTRGMDAVQSQFARISSTGSVFAAAYKHIAAYKKAMGSLGEFADNRKDVVKSGSNVGLFDAMIGDLKKLYPILKRQEAAVDAQQQVVDRWNDKLEDSKDILDGLQKEYDKWTDKLNSYANAPLQGMGEMQDAINANELAQKKLNLEMLKWEEANGSIDSLRDRLAGLYGDIEMLTGQATNLRQMGAGSDILGPIRDQIAGLEAQAAAVENAVKSSPVNDMQKQMDDLSRQGQILQLEYDVKFDPLTQQIAKLADTTKELSFEDIIAGMRKARDKVDQLQGPLNKAQSTYNSLQDVYDREAKKLDNLQDAYGKTKDVVSDLEEALRSMGGAAAAANQKADAAKKAKTHGPELSNAVKTFRAGAGGNWPDVGGKADLSREGKGNETDLIKQFSADQLDKVSKRLGKFDMFAPIKKKWHEVWGWVKTNVGPVVGDALSSLQHTLREKIDNMMDGGTLVDKTRTAFNKVKTVVLKVVDVIKKGWALFGPDLIDIFHTVVDALVDAWKEIGPVLGPFFKQLMKLLKPIIGIVLLLAKVFLKVFAKVLGPVLHFVIDIIQQVIIFLTGLMRVINGALQAFIGLFQGLMTGNWGKFFSGVGQMIQGVFEMISGLAGGIVSLLWNGLKVVWGIVWGVVKGIYDFFVWLWDVLVGHSVVPDMINAIIDTFKGLVGLAKWVWNHVLQPVVNFFIKAAARVISGLKKWWGWIKSAWSVLRKLGGWIWDHVLKPVWDKVKWLWNNAVKPALARWWQGIKTVWAILKTLGKWIWDHVLKPVWDKAKDLWDRVKTSLGRWWQGIKNTWQDLKSLGKWVWDHVMLPVFNKIKEGWTKVKEWLTNSKDFLTKPAKSIVNGAIKAINFMIKGLNKISDVLPGIDFHINPIAELAQGGKIPSRRVGNGFVTNGARAIVGEGKPNHPEFVIPTDPTYRHRAVQLLGMAQQKLGIPGGDSPRDARKVLRENAKSAAGVPMYFDGGIIGDIGKAAWKEVKKIPGKAADAAKTLAKLPFKFADSQLKKVSWSIPRGVGRYGLNKAQEWAGLVDSDLSKKMKDAEKKYGGWGGGPGFENALKFAKSQVGKPYVWGGVGPNGYDCSGFMSAITNVIRGKSPYSRVGATASFPWAGFNWGPGAFTIGSTRSYAGGVGHMAGTLLGVNVESRGSEGVVVGSRARGFNDPGFDTIAHLSKAAKGAIVRASSTGSFIHAGEGGHDEAVLPLPHNWRKDAFSVGSSKETHIHINGNLEFPNIKSGADAEQLIENLVLLTED